MPEILGEYIDRLVTVEMRIPDLSRGKTHRLHTAARKEAEGPLVLRATQGLQSHDKRGDRILTARDGGDPPWLPKGKSDGPRVAWRAQAKNSTALRGIRARRPANETLSAREVATLPATTSPSRRRR